ncbi:hypothetical protein H696_02745 [Fonticula alba]|uniref:Uncharacterized protein n=1 Tax=Fonticula alba TaxID=691883 RepID=A0A058Z7Z2_FONAL|nr:hypothetical protein H696_02745 [Fonticula alba]KCV70409.1 hypothetical protein H696_02745 [Fonticula alba]|eukprot:XP_009494925.1 hypothetical protein H696_02745 [Fonticula alba]
MPRGLAHPPAKAPGVPLPAPSPPSLACVTWRLYSTMVSRPVPSAANAPGTTPAALANLFAPAAPPPADAPFDALLQAPGRPLDAIPLAAGSTERLLSFAELCTRTPAAAEMADIALPAQQATLNRIALTLLERGETLALGRLFAMVDALPPGSALLTAGPPPGLAPTYNIMLMASMHSPFAGPEAVLASMRRSGACINLALLRQASDTGLAAVATAAAGGSTASLWDRLMDLLASTPELSALLLQQPPAAEPPSPEAPARRWDTDAALQLALTQFNHQHVVAGLRDRVLAAAAAGVPLAEHLSPAAFAQLMGYLSSPAAVVALAGVPVLDPGSGAAMPLGSPDWLAALPGVLADPAATPALSHARAALRQLAQEFLRALLGAPTPAGGLLADRPLDLPSPFSFSDAAREHIHALLHSPAFVTSPALAAALRGLAADGPAAPDALVLPDIVPPCPMDVARPAASPAPGSSDHASGGREGARPARPEIIPSPESALAVFLQLVAGSRDLALMLGTLRPVVGALPQVAGLTAVDLGSAAALFQAALDVPADVLPAKARAHVHRMAERFLQASLDRLTAADGAEALAGLPALGETLPSLPPAALAGAQALLAYIPPADEQTLLGEAIHRTGARLSGRQMGRLLRLAARLDDPLSRTMLLNVWKLRSPRSFFPDPAHFLETLSMLRAASERQAAQTTPDVPDQVADAARHVERILLDTSSVWIPEMLWAFTVAPDAAAGIPLADREFAFAQALRNPALREGPLLRLLGQVFPDTRAGLSFGLLDAALRRSLDTSDEAFFELTHMLLCAPDSQAHTMHLAGATFAACHALNRPQPFGAFLHHVLSRPSVGDDLAYRLFLDCLSSGPAWASAFVQSLSQDVGRFSDTFYCHILPLLRPLIQDQTLTPGQLQPLLRRLVTDRPAISPGLRAAMLQTLGLAPDVELIVNLWEQDPEGNARDSHIVYDTMVALRRARDFPSLFAVFRQYFDVLDIEALDAEWSRPYWNPALQVPGQAPEPRTPEQRQYHHMVLQELIRALEYLGDLSGMSAFMDLLEARFPAVASMLVFPAFLRRLRADDPDGAWRIMTDFMAEATPLSPSQRLMVTSALEKLIKTHGRAGDLAAAARVFAQARDVGITPTAGMYSHYIRSLITHGKVVLAERVYSRALAQLRLDYLQSNVAMQMALPVLEDLTQCLEAEAHGGTGGTGSSGAAAPPPADGQADPLCDIFSPLLRRLSPEAVELYLRGCLDTEVRADQPPVLDGSTRTARALRVPVQLANENLRMLSVQEGQLLDTYLYFEQHYRQNPPGTVHLPGQLVDTGHVSDKFRRIWLLSSYPIFRPDIDLPMWERSLFGNVRVAVGLDQQALAGHPDLRPSVPRHRRIWPAPMPAPAPAPAKGSPSESGDWPVLSRSAARQLFAQRNPFSSEATSGFLRREATLSQPNQMTLQILLSAARVDPVPQRAVLMATHYFQLLTEHLGVLPAQMSYHMLFQILAKHDSIEAIVPFYRQMLASNFYIPPDFFFGVSASPAVRARIYDMLRRNSLPIPEHTWSERFLSNLRIGSNMDEDLRSAAVRTPDLEDLLFAVHARFPQHFKLPPMAADFCLANSRPERAAFPPDWLENRKKWGAFYVPLPDLAAPSARTGSGAHPDPDAGPPDGALFVPRPPAEASPRHPDSPAGDRPPPCPDPDADPSDGDWPPYFGPEPDHGPDLTEQHW